MILVDANLLAYAHAGSFAQGTARWARASEARTAPALAPSSPIQSGSSSTAGLKAARILPIASMSHSRASGQRSSSVTWISSG